MLRWMVKATPITLIMTAIISREDNRKTSYKNWMTPLWKNSHFKQSQILYFIHWYFYHDLRLSLFFITRLCYKNLSLIFKSCSCWQSKFPLHAWWWFRTAFPPVRHGDVSAFQCRGTLQIFSRWQFKSIIWTARSPP